jgi:predicted transcriptional regulator
VLPFNTGESKMATTSVKLSDDMNIRLRHLADSKRRTPHWVMVEAINRYIEQEERKAAFYADALTSWNEYQQDGLHVTWNEAKSWISAWGTTAEKEAPQCHR